MPNLNLTVEELKSFYSFFSSINFLTFLGLTLVFIGVILPRYLSTPAMAEPAGETRTAPATFWSVFKKALLVFVVIGIGFFIISEDARHKKELRIKANNIRTYLTDQKWTILGYNQISAVDPSISEGDLDAIGKEFDNDFVMIKTTGNQKALRINDAKYLEDVDKKKQALVPFYHEVLINYLKTQYDCNLPDCSKKAYRYINHGQIMNTVTAEIDRDVLIRIYTSDTSHIGLLSQVLNGIPTLSVRYKEPSPTKPTPTLAAATTQATPPVGNNSGR